MPPFVVAHRAGNGLETLRRAEALDVDLVEADIRLFRGRLAVRHLKTVGSLPLYWDRWTLASPFRPELYLSELLREAGSRTELMLDLKGPRRRLAELVLEELRPFLGLRRFTVSARSWRLLDAFEGVPVRRVASAGRRHQLTGLLRHFAGRRIDGVAAHEGLLNEAVVADIRRVTELVLTWPVNVPARARALLELGVDGLISDRIDDIAPIAAAAHA